MIPRTLVPRDVKPVNPGELKKTGSRVTTYMDDRTVVPSGLSDAPPLDGKSNIPAHLPLSVYTERTLVPRGLPAKPIERSAALQEAGSIALEVLDARTVVPAHVNPVAPEQLIELERRPEVTPQLREVIEPDIFITGDANLLIEPEEKHDAKWDNIARVASIVAHIALILFFINIPNIFKPHVPTQEEVDLARRQLSFIYTPPEAPPRPPAPKIPRIDPKMLERITPPVAQPVIPQPTPQPQPVKPQPDLPEAPTPHVAPQQQPPPQQTQQTPTQQPPSIEPLKPQPNGHLNLQLPSSSAGKALQDQMQDAMKHQSPGNYSAQQRLPGGGGAQGGNPSVGNSVQILTPTEGVDFNSYIQRMLATIKRNWYAVMPQSAMLGDKGMVYVTFQINPDGSVQAPDPQMERTSSKEALDNAAMSAIRASNPFEPLPKEFHGPYMRFGIFFLYNLPLDYVNQ